MFPMSGGGGDRDKDKHKLSCCGILRGHSDWVTSLSPCNNYPDRLVSGSRDKSLLVWKLNFGGTEITGEALRRLKGHSHFVSDLNISLDSEFALSASWDKTLRLWDLKVGGSIRQFVGHTKDVLGASFSSDNRQIVSCGRDKTVRLWNTLAHCKYDFGTPDKGHTDWVSCVKLTPSNDSQPLIISAGWDKEIKTWDLTNCKYRATFLGHSTPILSMALAPDGSLAATGGKDTTVSLWDLCAEEHLQSLSTAGDVNALQFNPAQYWLAAAVGDAIVLYDLDSKEPFEQVRTDVHSMNTPTNPQVLTLAWSQDGKVLFSGHSDSTIRIWKVEKSAPQREY